MRHRPLEEETPEKTMRISLAWLRAALAFGTTMSKDPETKVGACVVSPDNMRASFGYNGFPMGVPDTPENWADKELKNSMVQHAELNALAKAPFSVEGATCYVTLKPCQLCLGALVNARVDRVVWLQDDGMAGLHWRYFNAGAFDLIRVSSGIRCEAVRMSGVEARIAHSILEGEWR